jgi:hypothetical protein
MSFEADQGLESSFWNMPYDWQGPWHRPTQRKDARYFPERGGGRRLRHPFLDPIVYPRLPDRTFNFGFDRLRKTRSVVIKTLDSSGVAKFVEQPEDVIIREVWLAQDLSTFTELFHGFHTYLREILPPGRFIGWQPKDLTEKSYFIEILDVQCGTPDDFVIEELGSSRPFLMREQLTFAFKLVREIQAPAGIITMVGA